MKHPHAENMMLYAQDALETDKPWERWELFVVDEWVNISQSPLWHENSQYRRKPRTIHINGFEVPEPVREKLMEGKKYWVTSLFKVCEYEWLGDESDNDWLKKGLIHLTQEAAALHGKALASFTEQKK